MLGSLNGFARGSGVFRRKRHVPLARTCIRGRACAQRYHLRMRTFLLTLVLVLAVGCGSGLGGIISNQVLFFSTFQPMSYELGQVGFGLAAPNQGNANPSATSLRLCCELERILSLYRDCS